MGQRGPKLRNLNGPVNGRVELRTGRVATRPTSLNIPNHLTMKEQSTSRPRTETLLRDCDVKPSMAEQAKPIGLNVTEENRTPCQRNHGCVQIASELETEQCNQPVCRDCCKSVRAVENKLENLSTSLQRLEAKLSADVESMLEILRASRHLKDVQTQV